MLNRKVEGEDPRLKRTRRPLKDWREDAPEVDLLPEDTTLKAHADHMDTLGPLEAQRYFSYLVQSLSKVEKSKLVGMPEFTEAARRLVEEIPDYYEADKTPGELFEESTLALSPNSHLLRDIAVNGPSEKLSVSIGQALRPDTGKSTGHALDIRHHGSKSCYWLDSNLDLWREDLDLSLEKHCSTVDPEGPICSGKEAIEFVSDLSSELPDSSNGPVKSLLR